MRCRVYSLYTTRDVIQHASGNDPVWEIIRFVPSCQHEYFEIMQRFHKSVTKKHVPRNTSKTSEGRSATFMVQGSVFFLTSIAARFLATL